MLFLGIAIVPLRITYRSEHYMENRIEELYQQYLSGQLSQADFEQLQHDVNTVSDEELWDIMCDNYSMTAETTKMNCETQQRMLKNIHAKIKRKKLYALAYECLRYASMLVLIVSLVGGSYWWLTSSTAPTPNYTYVNVLPGNKSKLTLPDGTNVTLNGNTQLRYDVEPGKHREVVLMKGEAYFDVAKDANCPFRVHVNDMLIEVLGTQFNVRLNEDAIETALFSGAVQLSSDSLLQDYQLRPGKKSIYRPVSHQITICDNDGLTDARWKDGYLAFNSQPFSKVLQEIENWYGVKIQLRNQCLANDKLTGAFYKETLESVLVSLSMQYGFKYKMEREHIIIE